MTTCPQHILTLIDDYARSHKHGVRAWQEEARAALIAAIVAELNGGATQQLPVCGLCLMRKDYWHLCRTTTCPQRASERSDSVCARASASEG